jgi:diadenosine tetraphosphate (Ap4A) HIT family hydrolase
MNDTFRTFGWPRTRIAELDHWAVMVRPAQPTLGALVLCCKQPARALGEVDVAGLVELGEAARRIDAMLAATVSHEKINYLMLMMVDPDVHFHVLPRYAGSRRCAGIELADTAWPGPPDLTAGLKPDDDALARLGERLAAHWSD